jgi:hypothetical protein
VHWPTPIAHDQGVLRTHMIADKRDSPPNKGVITFSSQPQAL